MRYTDHNIKGDKPQSPLTLLKIRGKVMKTLKAKYDCIMGKCKHFTIGKLGDEISGGIYIKKGIEAPDKIVVIFKEAEEKEKNEIN